MRKYLQPRALDRLRHLETNGFYKIQHDGRYVKQRCHTVIIRIDKQTCNTASATVINFISAKRNGKQILEIQFEVLENVFDHLDQDESSGQFAHWNSLQRVNCNQRGLIKDFGYESGS